MASTDAGRSDSQGRDRPPRLAILFWIYKEQSLCVARAKRLRRQNPDTPIFTLFGGPLADAPAFERALEPYCDDFYAFSAPWAADRKWRHGDQVINAWHRERGSTLDWDTIFIAQWDLLLLAPLNQLCAALKVDELILPGLRPVREVEQWWWWTRPGEQAADYKAFTDLLGADVPADPLCCNFVTAALPRRFLDAYAARPEPDVGFLEYKIPMCAQALGLGFCRDHPFNTVWRHEPSRNPFHRYFDTLHAEKYSIPTAVIQLNALLPGGRRVFHPYTDDFRGLEPWRR